MIVAPVIDGEDERLFILREQKAFVLLKGDIAVLVGLLGDQIAHADQDPASVIHLLGDLVELIDGRHPCIDAGQCVRIPHRCIERSSRVDDERVVEYMRDLCHVLGFQRGLRGGVPCNRIDEIRIPVIVFQTLKERDRSVIIVGES